MRLAYLVFILKRKPKQLQVLKSASRVKQGVISIFLKYLMLPNSLRCLRNVFGNILKCLGSSSK